MDWWLQRVVPVVGASRLNPEVPQVIVILLRRHTTLFGVLLLFYQFVAVQLSIDGDKYVFSSARQNPVCL